MTPDLSRSRAVLIGNAAYSHPGIPDLPGAAASLAAMEELLTGGLCGWPADRVTCLADVGTPSDLALATVAAIRDVEDVLLVYFVGHGAPTSGGGLALMLGRTDPDPETLPHTAMVYESLASIMRGCPAATKLVVLDCCHAELSTRSQFLFQGSGQSLADAYPVDGLYVIGASAMHEKAKAPLDGSATYFTDAFVDVVEGGIPRLGPTLRLDQIFLELRLRLVRANRPQPVESGVRDARRFPFARNAAAPGALPPAPVPLPPPPAPSPGVPPAPVPVPPLPAPPPVPVAAAGGRRAFLASATVGLLGLGESVLGRYRPRRAHRQAGPGPTTIAGPSAAAPRPPVRVRGATPLGAPISDHDSYVTCVAFSPAGRSRRTLASGSNDATIHLWDVSDPGRGVTRTASLSGHEGYVQSIAYSPDGATLASGSADATVRLWNTASSAPAAVGRPLLGHRGTVRAIAYGPRGATVASGGDDQRIFLWDVADPARARQLGAPLNGSRGPIGSVAFSPDGRTLAGGCDEGTVLLWNVSDPARPVQYAQPLLGHELYVPSLAFSPDGRTLAGGSDDGTIMLWNVSDPARPARLGRPLTGHGDTVWSVAFSPDGRTLASGGNDRRIFLWDVFDPARGTRIGQPLAGYGDDVSSVVFDRDGRMLAGACGDGTVRLWHLDG